ncbi:peptidoglycan DD-metalloendopeptidase family protein [Shewanella pneumatophori]|uniref:Peptidoglycan DD-metalloendopeptidase family protein n=1 Tax=Shewanella pneumatophori TaxID=314092 RepID=A0A9X2CEE9_9GAMM|nr:peptidoglycan DD-metalloendopeptidase family protein [Shewanella pneumatophori]MCL1138842.1 peptidoglycan DD-metalloendopeptidase family protein [Shewanella pneumatophori]
MGKVITLFKLLPKLHQMLLCGLVFVTLIIIFMPSEDVQASKQTPSSNGEYDVNTRYSVPLAFREPTPPSATLSESTPAERNRKQPLVPSAAKESVTATEEKVEAQPPAPKLNEKRFQVKSGDTLAALFERAGLTAKDVYDVTQLPKAKKNLLKIMPGDNLVIAKNEQGKLVQLRYHLDKITTLIVDNGADGYKESIVKKTVEARSKFASATIENNFWNAGVNAGLTPNQIMQLATIFGWDVDFALDLRKGDQFSMIFEEEFADGEFLKNGNILAAEFINQGDRYTAVRYKDGTYYSEDGRSMRKAFLRSPVDFKYVSSSFNPRRLHPVTGQVRAHRGVDYVAAVGTPIKAAGNGRVIKSSYNQYNGNYVFIKHNDTYTTKYLHLTKRNVKTGQSVKQGQIIGTLGSTGRVTGPHLHYEFIVNGVHRNPRTIKLPKSDPIAKKEKAQFAQLSKTMMAELAHHKQVQIAAH